MSIVPKLRPDLAVSRSRDTAGNWLYTLQVPETGAVFEFGPEEHHLLSHLDGSRSRSALVESLRQAHGVELDPEDLDRFLEDLRDNGLLEVPTRIAQDTVPHPRGSLEERRRRAAEFTRGRRPAVPGNGRDEQEPWAEEAEALQHELMRDLGQPLEDTAMADIPDDPDAWAIGGRSDRGAERGPRGLFRPPLRYWPIVYSEQGFDRLGQWLSGLAWLRWLVPVGLIAALFVIIHHWSLASLDLGRLWTQWNLIAHLTFSMLTVNLAAKFASGVAAGALGAQASSFGIGLAAGLVPRFHTEIDGDQDLPRATRLRLYATPLLVTLGLLAIGVLGWYLSRPSGTQLASFFLILALVSTFSLVLAANPLGRGYGYALVSTWYGVPEFRGRAFRALFERWLPKRMHLRGEERDSLVGLRAYALSALAYIALVAGFFLYLAATWLEGHFSGAGVLIFLALVAVVLIQWWQQTRRWRELFRDEGAPGRPGGTNAVRPAPSERGGRRWWWLLPLALLAATWFIPYTYETSGPLELRPARSQEVYAEHRGIVDEVRKDTGAWVEPGTVLGRLVDYRQRQELAVVEAMIARQQARLEELLTTPREAELNLSERQHQAARVEERFAREQLQRQEQLLRDGHTTQENYETSRRRAEIAIENTLETAARLELVREGPHPQEVEAARAELRRLQEQRILAAEMLQRTEITSAIEGRIADLELKNRVGTYLDEGDLFAEIIDDRALLAHIRVPEVALDRLQPGAQARIRLWAFPHQVFIGSVEMIEPRVQEDTHGRVIRVIVNLPNDDGLLRGGMTGYGKIELGRQPALLAFTQPVVRFLQVEMWSWIP